jgi:hypothetical protein
LAWLATSHGKLRVKVKAKFPPLLAQNIIGWEGVALLGLAHPIVKKILNNELVTRKPFQIAFIGLMFVATIAFLVFLYKSRETL